MMVRATSAHLTLAEARRHWHGAQGLGTKGEGIEATIAATGHLRALGGVDTYLAARSRVVGVTGADLDAAAARRDVQVLPAARGCMYLVPRADASLMLAFAGASWRTRTDRDLVKAGSSAAELDDVCAAVLATLAHGPLTPAALRAAMPAGSVRSLGAAGKKAGLSTPLPPALRALEFEGKVGRSHESGQLDTERYVWGLASGPLEPAPARPLEALAERYIRWAGPATRDEFAAWSGAGKRACQAAIDAIDVVPVAVETFSATAFMSTGAAPEAPARVHFLGFMDNYISLRRGPGPLTAPQHHDVQLPQWGRSALGPIGEVAHLQLRPLLVGTELVGFWEYCPDDRDVVWSAMHRLSPAHASAVADEAALVGTFLREDIGHGRSYSLDTDDAARERVRRVRDL